jgi:hypothetical protein
MREMCGMWGPFTLERDRMAMRLWITAIALAWTGSAAGEDLDLSFGSQGYDHRLFTAESPGLLARWSTQTGGLRSTMPPGKANRPPTLFAGLFQLEGDFEITVDYTINRLPRPSADDGTNNLEILLRTHERMTTMFRCNRREGDAYGFFAQKPDGTGVLERFPTTDKVGRTGIRRSGSRLTFSCGKAPESMRDIGAVEFGSDPITQFALQVLALNSTDGLDIRFDRLQIRAGKIFRFKRIESPGSGMWTWIVLQPLFALGIGLVLWRAFARRGLSAEPAR